MTHRAPLSHTSFKPGETAQASGIYHIQHSQDHRQSHEVVFAMNDRFPTCEICEDNVRYTLMRAAPFAFEDPDFRDSERHKSGGEQRDKTNGQGSQDILSL
jgi:predicted nucleic acid-binding Zn ribbon protein